MIDITAAKWDLSKEERYAIKWFEENGFEGKLERQFLSKTKFTVTKDGLTDRFELPQGYENMNIVKYMQQYGESFKQYAMLNELREKYRQCNREES